MFNEDAQKSRQRKPCHSVPSGGLACVDQDPISLASGISQVTMQSSKGCVKIRSSCIQIYTKIESVLRTKSKLVTKARLIP